MNLPMCMIMIIGDINELVEKTVQLLTNEWSISLTLLTITCINKQVILCFRKHL
jgi:hypothetical protein